MEHSYLLPCQVSRRLDPDYGFGILSNFRNFNVEKPTLRERVDFLHVWLVVEVEFGSDPDSGSDS